MRRVTFQFLCVLAFLATGLLTAGSGLSLGLHDRFAHASHSVHAADDTGSPAHHSHKTPVKEHRAHDCPVCYTLATVVLALTIAFVLVGGVQTARWLLRDGAVDSQTLFRFDAPSRAPPALA